jgi:hypothetical protein
MEIYIFRFTVFNYIYWALFRAPGWARRDGLQRMGLDDDISIRNVLPFWDALFLGAQDCGFLGSLCLKFYMGVAMMYLHPLQPFPCVWGSRNGWMGWDVFG